jgi:transposase
LKGKTEIKSRWDTINQKSNYLRTLLIHGARTVTRYCDNKIDKKSQWVARKKLHHGANKAAVALANKNARIIWAIMATGACYQPELACAA